MIFGGIAQGFGMPPFEFLRTASMLKGSKVFIRDRSQSWYQNGLAGHGNDIPSLRKDLASLIGSIDHEEVFCMGNSMGGFGAILFGSDLPNARVIAFSPQTFISRTERLLHWDRRWASQIRETYNTSGRKDHIYDLRPYLRSMDNLRPIEVHFCPRDRLDRAHALHLKGLKNVTLLEHDIGGHNLVKSLRDSGELLKIIG